MTATVGKSYNVLVPKRRQKHYSYDESLNEAAKLIADEPADVEKEAPAEENKPVEQTETTSPPEPPAFEE